MGRPAGWMKELTGRSPMKSPGAPSLRREVERAFWVEIATGVTTEAAAARVGVSSAVGTRWFRHRGGMPIDLSPSTGRYLSFREREEIAILTREARASERSPTSWVVLRRPSRESCGGTRRHGAGSSSIEHRSRNGRRSWSRNDRRPPSSSPTSDSRLRPGPSRRSGPPSGRKPGARSVDRPLEGAEQATPSGPAMGAGVEPRADRSASEGRFPR